MPTIEEDNVDDETIDVLSKLEREVSKVNEMIAKPKLDRHPSKIKLDYNSDSQNVERQLSGEKSEGVNNSVPITR